MSGGSGGKLPQTGAKATIALAVPVLGTVHMPVPEFIAILAALLVAVGVLLVRYGWRRGQTEI